MTAEEKCAFLKQLIKWAKSTPESEYLYMEERIYAVRVPNGMVVLVEANNPKEAVAKANNRTVFIQNGSNNYQIHNVGILNI